MKLFCYFNLHKWSPYEFDDSYERCLRCDKERIILRVILESDARKMGVSEDAIKRGYLLKDDFEVRVKK